MAIKSIGGSSSGKKKGEVADMAMLSRSKKKQQLLSNKKSSQGSGLKMNCSGYASQQAAPKVIQKKIIKHGRKSETSQDSASNQRGIN